MNKQVAEHLRFLLLSDWGFVSLLQHIKWHIRAFFSSADTLFMTGLVFFFASGVCLLREPYGVNASFSKARDFWDVFFFLKSEKHLLYYILSFFLSKCRFSDGFSFASFLASGQHVAKSLWLHLSNLNCQYVNSCIN